MRNLSFNRRKRPLKAAALILALFFIAFALEGCGIVRQKYLFSINFACIYDSHTGLFVNASQEYNYSDKTFISVKNNKPSYKKGTVKEYSISSSEIKFKVGYIIEDGKLCIAPPLLYNTTFTSVYILPDEKSALFVFNESDLFIINVIDDEITPVFDVDPVLTPNADYIRAEIISISPDGQYILYKSNRNTFTSDAKSFDLFAKNLVSGEDRFIMNFDKKEVISWNKEEDGSFLYREDITESGVSGKKYSEIFTYSLVNQTDKVFWNMKDQFRSYEIIDDTYLYVHDGRVLDVINYYNKDLIFIDTGMYSVLKDVKLSPDNGYAAMYGIHTNIDGKLITEVISFHLETNNTISHTEDTVKSFIVDSYHFGKRDDGANLLIINYFDTATLKYKSEFYLINHKYVVPEFKQNFGNADE